jgi:hypothetical protein
MVLAAVGAALIHYDFLWTDSLGIAVDVFVLVGAFMLYRIFFGATSNAEKADAGCGDGVRAKP